MQQGEPFHGSIQEHKTNYKDKPWQKTQNSPWYRKVNRRYQASQYSEYQIFQFLYSLIDTSSDFNLMPHNIFKFFSIRHQRSD